MLFFESANRRYLWAGGTLVTLLLLVSAFHTADPLSLRSSPDDRFLSSLIDHSAEYANEYHEAPFDGRAFRVPDHISPRVKAYIPPITPVSESYDADVVTGPEVRDGRASHAIPRTIYQTWKTGIVGPRMMAAISSWVEMNPEYEYILLNDTTANAYVDSFSSPKHVDTTLYVSSTGSTDRFAQNEFVPNGCGQEEMAPTDYLLTEYEMDGIKDLYRTCRVGAAKADVLRYMIMYEYGGVYFDVDSACERPLREWIDTDATLVTNVGLRHDPAQWGLIAAPGHPFMAQVLRHALRKAKQRDAQEGQEMCPSRNVEGVAGPPVLHEAVRSVLCNPELGGVVDRLQLYGADQFNGRIRFKAEGVDPEREAQGHKHWYDQGDL